MRRVRTRRRRPVVRTGPSTVQAHRLAVQARAWCGPAHGMEWALPPGTHPADVVELATAADGAWSYRLALHPVTRCPARDHHGRLVYLPVSRSVVADTHERGGGAPGWRAAG